MLPQGISRVSRVAAYNI